MRRLFAGVVALCLTTTFAFAQSGSYVKQSGSITPNTVPYWVTNGVIGGGVTAADSPVTSFGVTASGSAGICANSARQSSGAWNALCLGFSSSGTPTINVQNYGTATAQPLQFVVNGTTYPFPGSLAGITINSTSITGGTPSGLLYDNAGTIGNLATANSGVLVTSASGVPSISSSLPSGLSLTDPTFASAASSNFMAQFQKTGAKSWNALYASLDIGSGSAVDNLELCSNLPCTIPFYLSDRGMVSVGNLVNTWPNMSGMLNDSTGPGIRIAGDAAFSDYRTYGDLPSAVTGAVNNGSGLIRLQVASTAGLSTGNVVQVGGVGGVPNATGIWTITVVDSTHFDLQGSTFAGGFTSNGWYGSGANSIGVTWTEPGAIPVSTRIYSNSALNVDGGTGGAFIILHPDSTLTGDAFPGELDLFAYGSSGSGTYFNKIRMGVRSGVNSLTDTLVMGSTGAYFPGAVAVNTNTFTAGAAQTVNGDINVAASSYITFGVVDGTSGYGLRDSAGVMQTKNSGGGWNNLASVAGSNSQVQFNSSGQLGTSANFTWDGTGINLGQSGALGYATFGNATSGTIKIQPVAGALGSAVLSLPAATDTLVGKATTDTFTNKTFNSAATGNVLQVSGVTVSAGQYPGTAANDNAAAGNVGEYVSSSVVSGSAVALATGTAANMTSISIPAGDWTVCTDAIFTGSSTTTATYMEASLSTASATLDTSPGRFAIMPGYGSTPFNSADAGFMLCDRFSVGTTTTIFDVRKAVFGTSTMSAYGKLSARRAR